MSFLVDTNVLSEATRARPEARVEAWLRRHEPDLYVSVLTIGEIRAGIERLPRGHRQEALRAWLQRACDLLEGRILSVNLSVVHDWGMLRARWAAAGVNVPTIDGLLAATAHRHRLRIVTRNQRDFATTGVKTVNPFD